MFHTKSQVAVETLLLVAVFVLVSSICAFIFYLKTAEIAVRSRVLEATLIVQEVQRAINTALIEGDGYSCALSLPATIGGASYELLPINSSNPMVFLKFDSSVASRPVISSNISCELPLGSDSLIRNIGGGINCTSAAS